MGKTTARSCLRVLLCSEVKSEQKEAVFCTYSNTSLWDAWSYVVFCTGEGCKSVFSTCEHNGERVQWVNLAVFSKHSVGKKWCSLTVAIFASIFFRGCGLAGWKSGLAASFSFPFGLFEGPNPGSFPPLCGRFVPDKTRILGEGEEPSVPDEPGVGEESSMSEISIGGKGTPTSHVHPRDLMSCDQLVDPLLFEVVNPYLPYLPITVTKA
jgi:hypothetical protein